MRAATISDTYDLLKPEAIAEIQKSDAMIHAGDFSSRRTLNQIREAMPYLEQFYYVRGNNDKS